MRRIKDTRLCFYFERRGRSVLIPCHCKAEVSARGKKCEYNVVNSRARFCLPNFQRTNHANLPKRED